MEKIFNEIKEYFDGKDNKGYFSNFIDYAVRVEGWFKAELISFFTIKNIYFDCEKSEDSKKIDFYLKENNQEHLIELKALSLKDNNTERKTEREEKRSLNFYFRECIDTDIKKLEEISNDNYKKWVLCFIYPKPNSSEWEKLLDKWEHKSKLKTNLYEFDDKKYFMALFKV